MSDYSHDADYIHEIMEYRHGDWFGADLLRLIRRADDENLEKFRRGFPELVKIVEEWRKKFDAGWYDKYQPRV
jgi:hypothetical protein